MDLTESFGQMPFNDLIGIELLDVQPGYVTGKINLAQKHSSNPRHFIAHGGVTYALADTVGGAAVISKYESVTPTIDMRIDYLAPATGEQLIASAEVIRSGKSVAVVDVDIVDEDDNSIATARGTYKTGGGSTETAWGR